MKGDIEGLIKTIARLPGIGQRSARRIALHLLTHKDSLMYPLSQMMEQVADRVVECESCGNYDDQSPCQVCNDNKRDGSIICVVEEVADLWAFERGGIFRGHYHVLGGTLSALEGRGPSALRIDALKERIEQGEVVEVIIATNTTIEGQTTAHYLTDSLAPYGIKVTRLAQGIPLGGELDYLDEGTLQTALQSRRLM